MEQNIHRKEKRKLIVMDRRFIGVKELSEYLGIKINTIYSWIATRKIPFYKIGRLPKFDIRDMDRWAIERKIAPVQ